MTARHGRGTGRGWSRVAGVAAIVAGIGFPPGVGFEYDDASSLHWTSHASGIVPEVAATVALVGLLIVRGERLGLVGRLTAGVGACLFALAALGNALITWSATVQDVAEGGLYFVGHDMQSAALPLSSLALGLLAVTMLRSRAVHPGATWLLLSAVPLAAATGPLLDAMGRDGGDAMGVVMAAMMVMWVWWGIDLFTGASLANEAPNFSLSTQPETAATGSAN